MFKEFKESGFERLEHVEEGAEIIIEKRDNFRNHPFFVS